jgi:phosphoribosylanthranilate isomerase
VGVEKTFKVIRSDGRSTLAEVSRLYPSRQAPPAFLVDASVPGQYGGTGKTADWVQANSLARRLPVLLAGGLHPGNVATAIRQVRPWGVDVASGIETLPGQKDFKKMSDFIKTVQRIQREEIV